MEHPVSHENKHQRHIPLFHAPREEAFARLWWTGFCGRSREPNELNISLINKFSIVSASLQEQHLETQHMHNCGQAKINEAAKNGHIAIGVGLLLQICVLEFGRCLRAGSGVKDDRGY